MRSFRTPWHTFCGRGIKRTHGNEFLRKQMKLKYITRRVSERNMQAKVLANTLHMDRKAWLEARKQGLGGSDVATIACLK